MTHRISGRIPDGKFVIWHIPKTVSTQSVCNSKKSLFVLFNATAESVNSSFLSKNHKKHFSNLTYQKKTSSNTLKIYPNIYRKNLSAIIYQLPISLQEIKIYRLSLSPRAFLKLWIIIIALVQKGLSCPSLVVTISERLCHLLLQQC